jgi:omega-6 fatty acid desaturase / acyl-lipid omega-6 desaturase (Delta-12 desaturase)
MNEILEAIPAECFERSAAKGLYYVARDLALLTIIAFTAHNGIPLLPNPFFRFLGWMVYGFAQGCIGTGIWILAHECGHQAFSPSRKLNDFVGWVLHSFLLVPYFSWQITHGKHHKGTGHLGKDMVYLPHTLSSKIASRNGDPAEFLGEEITEEKESKLYDLLEDAPLFSLFKLVQQQLIGWQGYLLLNISGQTYPQESSTVNHFNPAAPLFSDNERHKILLSDLGLLITFAGLIICGRTWGLSAVLQYYVLPYFWVHHWLVMITFLQHTDPALPHYREGAWNFQRGAAATIDRDFGFIGQHLFHDIIEVPPPLTKLMVDPRCSPLLLPYSVLQRP